MVKNAHLVARSRQTGISLGENALHAEEESSFDLDRLSLLMARQMMWMMVVHVMMQVRRLRWKRMMIERRRRRMVVEVIGVNLWIWCCRRCDVCDGRWS